MRVGPVVLRRFLLACRLTTIIPLASYAVCSVITAIPGSAILGMILTALIVLPSTFVLRTRQLALVRLDPWFELSFRCRLHRGWRVDWRATFRGTLGILMKITLPVSPPCEPAAVGLRSAEVGKIYVDHSP